MARQLTLAEGDMVVLKQSVVRKNPPRFQCAAAANREGCYQRRDKWGKIVVDFNGTTRRLGEHDVDIDATQRLNRYLGKMGVVAMEDEV